MKTKKLSLLIILVIVICSCFTIPVEAKNPTKKLITHINTETFGSFDISYNSKGLISKIVKLPSETSTLKDTTTSAFKYYKDGRLKKLTETYTKEDGSKVWQRDYTYIYDKKKLLTNVTVYYSSIASSTDEPEYKITASKKKVTYKRSYAKTDLISGKLRTYNDEYTYIYKDGFIGKVDMKTNTILIGYDYTIDKAGKKTKELSTTNIDVTEFTYDYVTNGNVITQTRSGGDPRIGEMTYEFTVNKTAYKKTLKANVLRQQGILYCNREVTSDPIMWAL